MFDFISNPLVSHKILLNPVSTRFRCNFHFYKANKTATPIYHNFYMLMKCKMCHAGQLTLMIGVVEQLAPERHFSNVLHLSKETVIPAMCFASSQFTVGRLPKT